MSIIPLPNIPSVSALVSDALSLVGLGGPSPWGIYTTGGQPVIVGDSCVAFDFKRGFRVPTYQTEQGGFQSYNKVQEPFDAVISFTKGGNDGTRGKFLDSVDAATFALTLFSIRTAVVTYPSATILRYDYKVTDKEGISLMTVNVYVQEVRITATPAFSNTATASGADPAQGGQVQAQPATVAQEADAAATVNGADIPDIDI